MENTITLDRDDIATAFGARAIHLLLHHRVRLTELVESGKAQVRVNQMFNQTGINTHFVMDADGNVRAAGTESHCMSYLLPEYVLVDRWVPKQGCGKLTHVIGTNGGKMPCGANLTTFGKTAPYYCDDCE